MNKRSLTTIQRRNENRFPRKTRHLVGSVDYFRYLENGLNTKFTYFILCDPRSSPVQPHSCEVGLRATYNDILGMFLHTLSMNF